MSDKKIDLSTALEEAPTSLKQPPKRLARKTPPPINPPQSSQTLSRTLSASSVLVNRSTPRKKSFSPTSEGPPGKLKTPTSATWAPASSSSAASSPSQELSTMKSLDDLARPYGESNLKESDHNVPTTPIDPDRKFTVTYKQDKIAGSRSSSRYYEQLGSRPWLPSVDATKRSSSVHIPYIRQQNSPPLTPELTLYNPKHSKSTGSVAVVDEQDEEDAPTQAAFRWYYASKSTTNQNSPTSATAPNSGHLLEDGELSGTLGEDAVPPLSIYAHIPKIFGHEPPQISGHTCTLVHGKLYIFGGRTDNGFSDKMYVFNCTTNTLTTPQLHGEVMPPCFGASAVLLYNKYIYYFGGADEENQAHNWVYKFNTKTNRFTKLQTVSNRLPEGRRGHSLVLHNRLIYLFGGQNTETMFNDVWKLSLQDDQCKWSEVISLEKDTVHWPSPRSFHTAHNLTKGVIQGVASECMIVFGGGDMDDTVFDEVWIFDYGSQRWMTMGHITAVVKEGFHEPAACETEQQQPPIKRPATPPSVLSTARTAHCSQMVGKTHLVVFGGHDGSELSSTVSVLDLKRKKWVVRPIYGMQTLGPCFHTGVIYDSRFYLVGGFDSNQILTGIKIIEIPMLPVHDMYY